MDQEIQRFVQAVLIAWEQPSSGLQHQALDYLSNFQANSNETWRIALQVFVEGGPEGRVHPAQARFYALRMLDGYFDDRFEPLDEDSFCTLQQAFVSYIQSEYVQGSAESNATFLRNKFSHTLTLFFLCAYIDQWPTFFSDLFTLISAAAASQSSQSQSQFNRHVSLLLFHLILEISGEVADQTMKSARAFTQARHTRDARVRDAVRERDAPRINEAVLTIIADSTERLCVLRQAGGDTGKEVGQAEELVDWGVRTYGSYVGWIDINLTVTPTSVPLLFSLLSDPSLPIRLATSVSLLRVVSKGLKEPEDKLQLIKVLSLGQVIDALESKTREQQAERGADTDEGEESYREALGRLLNALGLELHKLTDDNPKPEVAAEATQLLSQIHPVLLRFMADEYDDTCSTVFPLLQTILAGYKKQQKVSSEPIDESKRSFLSALLQVILQKMKWDGEEDPADLDEDDIGAFETLRKDLRTFLDSILTLDQALVTGAVKSLALNILGEYQAGIAQPWNQLELGVYLVYIFNEINKSGAKGRAAYCQGLNVPKEQRKDVDYSSFPLTDHGEMMLALIQSNISAYPHRTVAMQFFETVARYSDFFKVRKAGVHSSDRTVRSRVYYLLHRFIREVRNDISPDVAVNLVDGIRDLLAIEVELPADTPEEEMLAEAIKSPGLFDSQLYLFEAVGTLLSLLGKSPEQQASMLLGIVTPLLETLSVNLQAAKAAAQRAQGQQVQGADIVPVLKVHHTIMALGNIAKGFPDYPNPVPEGYALPPLDVFREVAQAILVSLEALNVYKAVRDATRYAFARIIATTGSNVIHLIPPLMANLLAHFEPSELVDFMNFIGLLIHRLQKELFDVLDQLIGPLTSHISQMLTQPVTGTDDALSLADTKRAYLGLLTSIVSSDLHDIFISERNKNSLQPLLETMRNLAEDMSEPSSQKSSFSFFGRCVHVWCRSASSTAEANGHTSLPGFEQFVYESLIPTAFGVLSAPQLNVKDGQTVTLLHEIANFLQTVCKTRDAEAYDFLANRYLPSQGWPADMAMEFTTKIRDLDNKAWRKWFTDFIRSSRSQGAS
ncbi:ARM repeat-containing protein [Coniophora puteana RWD-64-598 SS2]|uniref:Exportin-T n=1 Tax=Coniophora puteana (strain RWD-64-598) TaxID=741705 RepID=A0A5M3MXG8_CONPW|nr:ARM repeat-containing protein [Coniophora puteana RWD-64-598 SS2]EIW83859.1 ARM repeat-containing protein [Coniophora puteana RWD-64-598 SS2]